MDRNDADRIITGLGAAHDRIAAAMYAVDSHPGLGFLKAGSLSGTTASRWAAVRPEIDLLWAHFGVLGDLLDRVRTIRAGSRPGDSQWPELTRLLNEPVVSLDAAGLPLDAGAALASRVRLWDLAAQLEPRCTSVLGHLSEVDTAWSAVAARLAPLSETLDAVTALASDLGERDATPSGSGAGAGQLGIRLTEQRLNQCREEYLGDPLAAAPGGRFAPAAETELRELSDGLAAERRRLADLAKLREEYPRRVADARALLDGLAAAERAVAVAYERATAKIADPGLPPPPDAVRVLRARLVELDSSRRAGQWRRLADDFAMLEQAAKRAQQRAAELREAADGLIARRDELRGRLDAYRAKAGAVRLAEDEELERRYTQAHEMLYTAPCDLRQATRSVFAYQQALAERVDTAEKESPR